MLSAGRGATGFGPARLGPLEMLAGIWLHFRVVPAPWEAQALVRLDAAWLTIQGEIARASAPPAPPPRPRQRKG